jgi:tetratricopeptide (TPR) repeat protein
MGEVYRSTGQPQRALALYDEALPIRRAVGDRAGEATTLHNMAAVYQQTGQPQRALALYDEALPIRRAVGDRAGEAATLNGLAYAWISLERYPDALAAFDQSIALERQVQHRAGEAAGLVGSAILLYQNLNRPVEAVQYMQQAIAVLETTGLNRAASGTTLEEIRQVLATMQRGEPLGGGGGPSTLPAEQIQTVVSNTIAVLTSVPNKHTEWRASITGALQQAQSINRSEDAEFFTAVLAFLDGQPASLPQGHPYAEAVAAIGQGIAGGGASQPDAGDVMQAINTFVNAGDWAATRQVVEAQQVLLFDPQVEAIFEQSIAHVRSQGNEQAVRMLELHLNVLRACKQQGIAATFALLENPPDLPFDPEIIPRSVAALRGGPQEKMAHAQYLTTLAGQSDDEQVKALVNTIQHALFGGNLDSLGHDLEGVYARAWAAIVAGIQQGDTQQ